MERRTFLKVGLGSAASGFVLQFIPRSVWAGPPEQTLTFKISLAQWSLNRGFFGEVEPKLDPLDFAKIANSLGIGGLEYVNQFFMDKARDKTYIGELKKRAGDYGCQSVLIMCDEEGNLGDPDDTKRTEAVENHYKWLEAAQILGCHSIRVNAHSEGSFAKQQKLVTDGLHRLCEKGQEFGLNVIVENHGGLSSQPDWLLGVVEAVSLPNCGTLPDFGNFRDYDPYLAVEKMMPSAKGISAKARYSSDGERMPIDFSRMMRIVRDGGWTGYVGIESSGSDNVSEMEAIRTMKKQLERVRDEQMKINPIFGDSLEGWTKVEGGDWTIKDGVIVGRNGRNWSTNPEVAGSWLRYDDKVKDFKLEFQWRINKRGNSGVFFRSGLDNNPAFTGYELQISSNRNRKANASITPGAIYDLVAPTKNAARPSGEWNTVTLICMGRRITVDLNFHRIVDSELDRSLEGYLGFQNHDKRSVAEYKNVRLQNL